MNIARTLVSKKKKRFIDDEYNLDLAYVTEKLIAMGFPSLGKEALYRNPMNKVQQFLESRHRDHYKVYNLCAERSYDPSYFHSRVQVFPFEDHNAPPLEMMIAFCKDADDWLAKDPQNIVVTHCKAGKGRTGVMICCYLIWTKELPTVEEVLQFYGDQRTHNGKGVTIPSQKRYVRYFGKLADERLPYRPELAPKIRLFNIVMRPPPNFESQIFFIVTQGVHKKELFRSNILPRARGSGSTELSSTDSDGMVQGDILIQFFHKMKPKLLCQVWFNTFFVETNSVVFKKHEIDKAHKDKKCNVFPEDFTITLEFSGLPAKTPLQSLIEEHRNEKLKQEQGNTATTNAHTEIKSEAKPKKKKKSKKKKKEKSSKEPREPKSSRTTSNSAAPTTSISDEHLASHDDEE